MREIRYIFSRITEAKLLLHMIVYLKIKLLKRLNITKNATNLEIIFIRDWQPRRYAWHELRGPSSP